jgi:hypothetical protein
MSPRRYFRVRVVRLSGEGTDFEVHSHMCLMTFMQRVCNDMMLGANWKLVYQNHVLDHNNVGPSWDGRHYIRRVELRHWDIYDECTLTVVESVVE